jgi:Phosphotransferase system IIB components
MNSLKLDNILPILIGLIVGVLILIFISFIKKSKKKNINKVSINLAELLTAIGEKTNLKDMSATLSKITFVLEDYKKVDTDKLKVLGASGIVENKNGLSVIFGKESPKIEAALRSNYFLK